jgi:cyclophilin family peptidyl-prolyl cis-trans isomerase
MIQGGDPLTKDPSKSALFGTGDPGVKFDDEFNDEPLIRGSIAMANSGPNTNGSQFFIVTAEATPWLDGVHTNIGRVIGGMDIVDAISQVDTDPNDRPIEDVKVISVKVAKK